MTERLHSQESNPVHFGGFQQTLEEFTQNRLPLNEVQALLGDHVHITDNEDSWESSTKTDESGTVQIKIGVKELPSNIRRMFRWGAVNPAEQYLVKLSHEYAHALQEEFDPSLLRWLDGADHIPEYAHAYVQLYALLNDINGLNGLSHLDLYHEQSRATGHLSVPVWEDMAETIGSYLLGTEYFLFRITNGRVRITEEQAKRLIEYLDAVLAEWKKLKEAT